MQSKQSHQDLYWQLFGVGIVIGWLLLWEWSIYLGLSRKFFVPPSELLVSLYQSVFVSGELRPHIWATLTRFVGGFMIGALPALWLGFIMGRNRHAYLRYGPILGVLGLTPMLFALPWFIIWFEWGFRQMGNCRLVCLLSHSVLHEEGC